MINIFVQKNEPRVINTEPLISGTANVAHIKFSLSDHWDGLLKTAVFTNGEQTINVLDTRWKSGNVCTIPWEVLTTAGKIVRVGLRATQQKRTVLATPMFGIGTVQLGTDPVGDKSADPALPVWEQLREDFSKRSYGCSTWLEKFTDPKVNSTIIRIHFANIDCIPAGARLHLYRCIRNRGARTHWVHPVDWHEDPKPGQHRWGYGLIQDKVDYPLVPDWMPNNGYMQTEFTISSADRELGYVDIPLSEYLLPLLKPVDKEHSWRELGFIEPYEYLMLVLSMLPYLGKSPAHEELEKLMPWHPAVRHREHIRK